MEEKINKQSIRKFVVITKVIPVVIAIIHLINSIITYFCSNDIPLNYVGGISLLPIFYMYIASYTFQLCNYYRMFLHYSLIIDIINILDYYINFSFSDQTYIIVIATITLITMLLIIKQKFFK